MLRIPVSRLSVLEVLSPVLLPGSAAGVACLVFAGNGRAWVLPSVICLLVAVTLFAVVLLWRSACWVTEDELHYRFFRHHSFPILSIREFRLVDRGAAPVRVELISHSNDSFPLLVLSHRSGSRTREALSEWAEVRRIPVEFRLGRITFDKTTPPLRDGD
jgi:hypothetical protein